MGEQNRIRPQDCQSIGSMLAHVVTKTLQDPVKRAEFEAWYLEKYGVPYHWKTYREVLHL